MDENNVVIKYLEKKGYNINTDYYKKIEYWKSWYQNHNKDFHEYRNQNGETKEVYKLGMAKRGCEDWSSILYTERDNIICNDPNNQEYIDSKSKELKLNEQIPQNIESAFWSGTLCTITRIKNAIVFNNKIIADNKTKLELVNVTADKIIPLRVEHGKTIDIAICSKVEVENKDYFYIEIHELKENGYVVRNVYLDEQGEEKINIKDNILKEFHTDSDIPLFNLLMPRIVNNIENNNGLGISVYANAIDQLKGCDLSYNNFLADINLGGKKVFYNKSLVKYDSMKIAKSDGTTEIVEMPIYPDDLTRQQFQVLSDDMNSINEEPLIHEYNPDLRIDDNEKAINLSLNLYSFKLGLGKGYYKFENGTIVTATQYLGENKDLVGNAKKHRSALNEYCVGLARSILLLGRLVFGEQLNENDEMDLIDKDGFLVSDEELQEQYRQDFQAGLMSKLTYLMKARGMTEEQAKNELELAREDNPQLKDLITEE